MRNWVKIGKNFASLTALGFSIILLIIVIIAIPHNGSIVINLNKQGEMWFEFYMLWSFVIFFSILVFYIFIKGEW